MIYHLANGVTAAQAHSDMFFVYAHVSSVGTYIGITKTLAKRWSGHKTHSKNPDGRCYTAPFQSAIRSGAKFTHYIIGAFNTERECRELEAYAISLFGTLNERKEPVTRSFNISNRIVSQGYVDVVQDNMNTKVYTEEDRSVVLAKIVYDKSRLRVKTVGCSNSKSGLFIECSRTERARWGVGQMVKVKVIKTEKKGVDYLVANKSATFMAA